MCILLYVSYTSIKLIFKNSGSRGRSGPKISKCWGKVSRAYVVVEIPGVGEIILVKYEEEKRAREKGRGNQP